MQQVHKWTGVEFASYKQRYISPAYCFEEKCRTVYAGLTCYSDIELCYKPERSIEHTADFCISKCLLLTKQGGGSGGGDVLKAKS
jgi:hypothetical protein